jgi:Cu-Zn family superoxide dismutase
MRFRNLLFISATLFAAPAFAQTAPAIAHADIVNAQGQEIGTAEFTTASDGVRVTVHVTVDVSQLPPGTHGMHIHTVGKCEGPDFKSAGGHFNPEGKEHGMNNPGGPHAGDLPNLEVGPDGNADATIVAKGVTLADGPDSLFHDGGTSLVIHEKADDYMTDPSGNSGARIACGVIQAGNLPQRSDAAFGFQMLSDTQGVDFSSYEQMLIAKVKRNWYAVIPESALKGERGVVFTTFQINPDGSLAPPGPTLERTSGKDLLDNAAMSAIHASDPFEPLPSQFHGPYLKLRLVFDYNIPPDQLKSVIDQGRANPTYVSPP